SPERANAVRRNLDRIRWDLLSLAPSNLHGSMRVKERIYPTRWPITSPNGLWTMQMLSERNDSGTSRHHSGDLIGADATGPSSRGLQHSPPTARASAPRAYPTSAMPGAPICPRWCELPKPRKGDTANP